MAQKRKHFFRKIFAHARLNILATFLVFGYGFLIAHLYSIQVRDAAQYSAKAQSQVRSLGVLEARRGDIFLTDKNGTKIQAAITREMPIVFAVPKEIEDPEAAAKALAGAIPSLVEDDLLTAFTKSNDPYEPILPKPERAQTEAIRELHLKGIYVDTEPRRVYPGDFTAAHVLGFLSPSATDDTLRGRYGLELFYDDLLRGQNGKFEEGSQATLPQNGNTLFLTIDYNIQKKAEAVLEEMIEKYRAKSGSVIVEDPKTGKILALTNRPAFNPNAYSQYSIGAFLNPSVQSTYEPGSIFKVITMAAGIDSGKITPQTSYYDSGSVSVSGRTIKNWDLKAHGSLTMTQVIEQSINTGTVFAERKMGHDIFYNYLLKFGIGEKTGIELPGERMGDIANLKKFRDVNFATASFGQGISVTPLWLISAVSAIANGGMFIQPTVIDRIETPTGGAIAHAQATAHRVIGEDAAKTVTGMMVSAVKKNVIADIPNYSVAGKTGTAQVPNLVSGGYYSDKVNNTYVGFAPASDPKFVILIKLDDPAGAPLAGETVVPAFRQLAEFIINYYGIAPDEPVGI
jgi:cell division protein FtsI/penicillin-binding protein 2